MGFYCMRPCFLKKREDTIQQLLTHQYPILYTHPLKHRTFIVFARFEIHFRLFGEPDWKDINSDLTYIVQSDHTKTTCELLMKTWIMIGTWEFFQHYFSTWNKTPPLCALIGYKLLFFRLNKSSSNSCCPLGQIHIKPWRIWLQPGTLQCAGCFKLLQLEENQKERWRNYGWDGDDRWEQRETNDRKYPNVFVIRLYYCAGKPQNMWNIIIKTPITFWNVRTL